MKKIFTVFVALMICMNSQIFANDFKTYTIQDGDTLYNISRNYNVSVEEIIELNPELADPDKIFAGDEMMLPSDEKAEDASNVDDNPAETVSKSSESVMNNTEAEKILELVNSKRVENGLKPLILSNELSKLAQEKCEDMSKNNYFGHNSKKNGKITDILEKKKIPYNIVGENLARNFQSAEKVFEAWMDSESHRTNILFKTFDKTGIYYLQTDNGSYWVQNFIESE